MAPSESDRSQAETRGSNRHALVMMTGTGRALSSAAIGAGRELGSRERRVGVRAAHGQARA